MDTELEELLRRSDELGNRLEDEEALEVNAAILDLEPGSPKATTRLGIGLLNQGRPSEAVHVLEGGLRLDPKNSIMLRRLDEANRAVARGSLSSKARSSSTSSARGAEGAGWTDFEVGDLVEGALTGWGRDACVRFCAASIHAAEAIDRQRTAVTPIKNGRRFRTIGGIFTGVGPWRDTLTVAVPTARGSVVRSVQEAGGYSLGEAKAILSVQLAIPRTRVDDLFEDLLPAHREHLALSLAAGPPTHMNKHHPELRQYLLDQANLLM